MSGTAGHRFFTTPLPQTQKKNISVLDPSIELREIDISSSLMKKTRHPEYQEFPDESLDNQQIYYQLSNLVLI